MHPFSYSQADDAQSAVQAVGSHPETRLLAGGTNLVDLLKLNVEMPAHIVGITTLPLTRNRGLTRRWRPHRRTGQEQ